MILQRYDSVGKVQNLGKHPSGTNECPAMLQRGGRNDDVARVGQLIWKTKDETQTGNYVIRKNYPINVHSPWV